MKTINLTKGLIAEIDDEDFDKVSQYKWFARKGNNTFYGATWVGEWRERKLLHLHHLIAGNPAVGFLVDHIDHNGLNNRKSNLRHATHQQNSGNRKPYGKSKYLGVSQMEQNGTIKWRAFIGRTYLGIFTVEEDAAKRYNEEAIKKYGEFANLNVIK